MRLGSGVRHSRRLDRTAGQSLVEFTMVFPFLLVLLMGAIDVGRIVFVYIALEDAVQEGAIYYSVEPTADLAAVTARVTSSSDAVEVRNATVSKSACSATTLSVTATYPLPLLTPVAAQLWGGTFLMSATFTGTNLTGPCS